MNLMKHLLSHEDRNGLRIRNKQNPAKGYCISCDAPLSKYGRTKINCEYHWLKRKYSKIKANIKDEKRYPYLKDIYLNMSWKEFILWAIENDDYKKLQDPALTRKDMGDDFHPDNLQWVEFKEVSKYKK